MKHNGINLYRVSHTNAGVYDEKYLKGKTDAGILENDKWYNVELGAVDYVSETGEKGVKIYLIK